MKTHVISLGGSLVNPITGFDFTFLKKFTQLIIAQSKKRTRFVIVVGGGAPARAYQNAAKKLGTTDAGSLDRIGIAGTKLNAQLLKEVFGDHAYQHVITDPRKRARTSKKIIIGAGWKEGFSSDMDAVLKALTYRAKEVFNLSNIDYVYDSDPSKNKHAKKIEEMGWKQFRSDIVGNEWAPGKSAPFDPIASRRAQRYGLTVHILNGKNLTELKKAFAGKPFKGTTIS